MAEYPELLFFDTFSHGSSQELNLDLVQFTNPVYVSEIRVIPLGARVQADFPGGVRLGATNPSEFSVEFFVNNLGTPGVSTFKNIGTLEYNQNGPIHHVCENKQIPTDGLILRGWYTTVTLAVYGFITKTRPPPSNLVPQNPPAAETPPPRVISEHKTAEWIQQHAEVYHKEPIPYDVKDLPFEKENTEWPAENAIESPWVKKNEQDKEKLESKEEKKIPLKEQMIVEEQSKSLKATKRHSNVENKFSDRESDHHETKKREEKKMKVERSHYSPPKSKSKSKSEIKKKSSRHESEERKVEPIAEPPQEIREKTPELLESPPKPATKEPPVVALAPVVPPSLAPEDVELISEEEISENEDEDLPSVSGMQIMDEVTDIPNETLTPSILEDSLDMDQFEPILSGSSDIESEEDVDLQDIEFDANDLIDEPSKIFDPFLFEVQPLLSLKRPSMTDYEWELMQLKISDQTPSSFEKIEKLKTLLSNIDLKPFDDNSDDWVTTVENIIPMLDVGLNHVEDGSGFLSKLTSIINVGLDFEKAYNQPKPVFKVRHLKAGIRLVETFCRYGEDVTIELVKSTNLQHKLLDLYDQEYVALSIKLAILRALDVSLNYGSSVKYFVSVDDRHTENGYRRLIKMLRHTRTARVRYALINVLRKVHLYETLENLYLLSADDKPNGHTAQNVEHFVMHLEETTRYLREAPRLICQPVRFLPICSRFEFPHSSNAYFTVYSYFNYFHLLDLLLTALTSAHFSSNSYVIACILEILAELVDTESGLIYLASEAAITNRIMKILLSPDEQQYSVSPQLGLHLAHRLYVLSLVDAFQYKWHVEQMADIDNTQLLEIVSSMYTLMFSSSVGKHAITHVLSRGDLIKPFLKALQYSHNTGRERRKSPGKAYILDLVWMVVKSSDHVPFLERHRSDLIEIASWQSDIGCSSWLNPVRNEYLLSYADVKELCDYLKKHTEKVITYPGELVTALRILCYLAIPPASQSSGGGNYNDGFDNDDESIELKYKYVLIQLFSQEGLTFMTSMLHKICNHYERPHLHIYTLAGKEGPLMMAVMLPALKLIRALLEYVVRSRDVDFKDLTAVPALLKTYCLLYHIPPTSPIHPDVADASREIVETLLAYTQTVAIEPLLSDSRSLNKSLWTSMMSEVLRSSVSVPETFVPCLALLSELLPLPLPMQTHQPLTDGEISLVVNSRRLWSAHLLPLDAALQEMIGILCWSSHQTLQQLLKRVCIQLADLGPPTSLVVARSVLTNLWTELQQSLPQQQQQTNESSTTTTTTTTTTFLSARCGRLLNILACMLTHPPLKMTVIQITSGSSKTDETFSEFWSTLTKHLLQPYEGNVYHAQAQEYIVSLMQCLCDIEISLYPPPFQCISLETYLSNSLPPKGLFRTICETLVKYLEMAGENPFSTLSLALRACITLTEYDHGMYRLKNCLSEHPCALYNVLRKVADEWSTENGDCINCLTSALEFFKECLSRDSIGGVANVAQTEVNLRTLSVSSTELADWIKWNEHGGNKESVEGAEEKHPLEMVEKLLCEFGASSAASASDEELYQPLRSNIAALVEALNAAEPTDGVADPTIEMILDPPESLLTQFQSRHVFVVGDVEEERLSAAYWLIVAPPLEDMEQESEQVLCNLEEIVSQFLQSLRLETELEKLGHREAGFLDQTLKKIDSNEPTSEFENKPMPTVLAVKPAKPRTFMRPLPGPHRNDAFRSRIPNSSRAPSLHVDDFIALEKHNQQQAATAAYNRVSGKHQVADAAAMRNRTHAFLQDRGNHFHSPFRPTRGILSTWHPLLGPDPGTRTVVKTQPSVIRHPGATPLMIRGSDLMRFSLSLRWPTPPLRPPPQMRHHPPPHASMHRHLRPPPPSF